MAPTHPKQVEKEELWPSGDLQTDNLGILYSEAADDWGESARCREASMLFSVAEGHVNDDDNPDEVIRSIKQSIEIFRDAGNSVGLADGLRLWMHGIRMKAAKEHEDGHGDKEEKLLEDAEEALRRELALFKACIDKRGEAAMLLAISEALCCLGGSHKLAEALDILLDAQDIARELLDVKLEALIAFERSTVLHKRHRFKQASQAAKEAQKLFNSIGDTQNEGFSWYALGSAQINNGRVEEGFVSKRKALTIYRRLGLKKLEGKCLCAFAEWYLMERDAFAQGIKFAQEAKAVFQDLGDLHWELKAHRLVVEGNYKMREYSRALVIAKEGLELAKESGAWKELFLAHQLIALVHMESNDIPAAMEAAAAVMDIAKEMEDPRNTAQALHLQATIYDFDSAHDDAEEMALQAIRILESRRRYEEEAFQEWLFVGRTRVKKDESENALAAVKEARNLARRVEDTYLEATAMLAVSGAHYGIYLDTRGMPGDEHRSLHEAKSAAVLSRELYHEEGYQRGEARVLRLALSDYYMEENNFKEALRCAQDGAQLMAEVGDNRMECLMKHRVAEIHLADNNPSDAAAWAVEALKLARMEEDRRATAFVLLTVLKANQVLLADRPVEDRQNRAYWNTLDKMERRAKEALGIAVEVRNTELEALSNLWVAIVHLMQGKEKKALQAAENSISLAKLCKEPSIEIDGMVQQAIALDALGDTQQATIILGGAVTMAVEYGYAAGKNAAEALLQQIAESQGRGAFAALLRPEWQRRPHEHPSTEVYRRPDIAHVQSFILQLVKNMKVTGGRVEAETPLVDMGVDSLAAVELRTQLQMEFRVNLPATVMYHYPSVSALARLLVDVCTENRIPWQS